MADVKGWLYGWLGKQKMVPSYDIRPAGGRGRARFKCEVRVTGIPYIGVGNSGSKKDSQANAAFDFCQYLIRENRLPTAEFPFKNAGVTGSDESGSAGNLPGDMKQEFPSPARSLPGGLIPPHMNREREGQFGGYGKYGAGASNQGGVIADYQEQRQQQFENRVADETAAAEGIDLTAKLHGGWTIDNGKKKLNEYCQQNRMNIPDIQYKPTGPDNNRSFVAEIFLYVPKLHRKLYAREAGSNKKVSGASAALSIVRQLFHLGVIEAFTGVTTVKKSESDFDPIDGQFSSELSDELKQTITELDLTPADTTKDGPLNIECQMKFEEQDPVPGGCIPWCPPIPTWNPWTGSNIDEGPYMNASMDDINTDIMGQEAIRQINPTLQETRNNLPIFEARGQLLDAIRNNTVVIVKGETGSGKTTQLPQYILEDAVANNNAANCSIIVTQPRKISAVSIADRIAKERGEEVGMSTGYSVRFESRFPRSHGAIMLCTVGVLLRKLESGLRGVSHVVIDEIHERDLNTDFMLVVLRDIHKEFPNVRIVLMSATIDTSSFSEYFDNAPVIHVSGRTFPVQQYFLEDIVEMLGFAPTPDSTNSKQRRNKRKREKKDDEEGGGGGGLKDDGQDALLSQDKTNCNLTVSEEYQPMTRSTVAMLDESLICYELMENLLKYIKSLNIEGSILIFLPGWNTIFGLMKHLQNHHEFGSAAYRILPLHSQIPREDQYRVFEHAPPGVTKVILSTNIAETSITIDDVSFVIDSCKVKMKMFTAHNNMTNYATVWASKSNLEQRKGRAGRVRNGYCFNVITRERFEKLDDQITPEILRTPLHAIGLSIKLLRLGGIADFLMKALAVPALDVIIEAEAQLKHLNALDKNSELTPLGQVLARLPLEPRLGRMLVWSCCFGVADAMCTIAAATCFNEPFEIQGKRMPGKHRKYAGDRFSDHVALLFAFEEWQRIREGGTDREESWCMNKDINMATMRSTWEARRQLSEILYNFGFPEEVLVPQGLSNDQHDERLDNIITLLSIGLNPNVAIHTDGRRLLVDGKGALMHKASACCPFGNKGVKFPYPTFVFGEKVRTRAVSARQTTCVTPAQLILTSSTVSIRDGVVYVDDWIPMKFLPADAANLCALRAELDGLLITAVSNPESVIAMGSEDQRLVQMITKVGSVFAIPSVNKLDDCHASIRGDRRDDMFGAPPPKTFSHGGSRGGGSSFNRSGSGGFSPGGNRGFSRGSSFSDRGSSNRGSSFGAPRPLVTPPGRSFGGGSSFGDRGGSSGGGGFGNNRGSGGFGNRGGGFGNRGGGFGDRRGGFGNRGGGFGQRGSGDGFGRGRGRW